MLKARLMGDTTQDLNLNALTHNRFLKIVPKINQAGSDVKPARSQDHHFSVTSKISDLRKDLRELTVLDFSKEWERIDGSLVVFSIVHTDKVMAVQEIFQERSAKRLSCLTSWHMYVQRQMVLYRHRCGRVHPRDPSSDTNKHNAVYRLL
ncbi:hypothetical protein J6590_004380 [Homalodisca vitripennis]|nr:hypothetical protein J6590_004380 [Homalodisca vitripennis]